MHVTNSSIATGRAGYDTFDCAQAVALIGFLGLISNFQDIIETFTNNANGRRKRRSGEGSILSGLSQIIRREPWEALQPVVDMVSWATEDEKTYKGDQLIDNTDNNDEGKDELNHSEDEPKKVTPFVNDIAMFGPQLALWVVDVADGLITGEEGRNGICQTINKMQENHGLAGSIFGNLLSQTIVKAMATHSPAEKLLKEAALHDNPNPCLGHHGILSADLVSAVSS